MDIINSYFVNYSPINIIIINNILLLVIYFLYLSIKYYKYYRIIFFFFTMKTKMVNLYNWVFYFENKIDNVLDELIDDHILFNKVVKNNILLEHRAPIFIYNKLNILNKIYIKHNKIDIIKYHNFKYIHLLISNISKINIFNNYKNIYIRNEIISMTKTLFDINTFGILNNSCEESLLLVCKSYRELGYKNNIKNPEIILTNEISVNMDNICHILNIKLVKIDLDNILFDAKNNINSNTILFVSSIPNSSFKSIELLSNIAYKYKIGLHIDYISAFVSQFSTEKLDLNLSGITSINLNYNTYGLSILPLSIILYKNKDVFSNHYYVGENSKLIYDMNITNSNELSIIIAWCILLLIGEDGYTKLSSNIISTTKFIYNNLKKNDYIDVIRNHKICTIKIKSNKINLYTIYLKMIKRKWTLLYDHNSKIITIHITHIISENKIKFLTDFKYYINNTKLYKFRYNNIFNITKKKIVNKFLLKYT